MRRSRASAWGALIVLSMIAGCSSRESGQGPQSDTGQSTESSAAAAASPTPAERGEAAERQANEAAPFVSQKLLESPFVERDENDVATYRLAEPAAAAPRTVPTELLVKFRRSTARARVENALSRVPQAAAIRAYRVVPQLYRVRIAQGTTLEQALDTYRRDPDVEYAEPNYVLSIDATPNDPRFSELWGLHNAGQLGGSSDVDIDAPESWDLTQGDEDIVVAVIDTGIDYNHPDLAANMYRNEADCDSDTVDDDNNGYINDCYGIDTIYGDTNPFDDHGHGTHVAGTIGAVGNNGIGVTGVAWNVKMLGCKFLGGDGYGTTDGAIECLEYIAALKDRGVNIIATNNSWGGGGYSLALQDAIQANMDRDILFIAAAGNYSSNNDAYAHYPCNYDIPSVVCVAAINRYGNLAWFSNRGRTTVDIGAPGEDILSTLPGATYGALSGTSMATPHVTGAAVLLKSRDTSRDWRAIKNLLITGSEAPLPTQLLAGSRINANESLTCTNRQWVRKLSPNTDSELHRIFRGVGANIELSAMSILCDGANGTVSVAVSNGDTVTLRDDGSAPDVIADDGIATGQWSATEAGQFTFTFPADETAEATIDAHLRAGFPVQLRYNGGGGLSGNFIHTVVGDVDGDTDLEILTSAVANGPVHAFNPDGTAVTGWPSAQAWGMGFAVIGNFDNTVAGSKVGASYYYGNSALFAQNGAVRSGWPQSSGNYYTASTPLAADLDGDGADEFIDTTIRRADGSSFGLTGVPQADAVADLDGDGDLELVSLERYSGVLRVHHHSGTEAPEYAQNIYTGYATYDAVAVGDVDGDGTPEIIVPVQNGSTLEVRLVTPWRSRSITVAANGYGFSGLALGDLTGDGIPEILVQTSHHVYALRGDGTAVAGWPIATGSSYTGNSAPAIGDLTGDEVPEVAVTIVNGDASSSSVHVWTADGSALDGFPKQVPLLGQGGVPAIADLERDGANELIVVGEYWSGYSGEYDKVWVFDVQGGGTAGPIEWGQHKGDAHHRAFYELGKTLGDESYLTVQLRGAGSVQSSAAGIDCGADCIELYPHNTSVTLTATPNGGTFVAWLGACEGQGNPCTVSLQDRTSVVAEFSRQPLSVAVNDATLGSIASSPTGIACPNDCDETFNTGTTVTLTATPVETASFSHWTGACTGSTLTCAVTMNQTKEVGAVFVPRPRLTITLAGIAGGRVTSSPAGIDCGETCEALFARNSSVTLTATETDDYIVNWSGACWGSSTCSLYMSGDLSVTATFIAKNELTLTKTGESAALIYSSPSGIHCGDLCSYRFASNTSLTLYISDSTNYDVTWSGACTGTNTYCSVSMNAARAVSAHITRKPVLTLTKTGSLSGIVQSNPWGMYCGSYCASASQPFATNSVVTLTASAPGYAVTWSGACNSTGPTCTVTMSESRSVSVNFSSYVPLQIARIGFGGGTVASDPGGIDCGSACTASFAQGSSITLVATPNENSFFSGWSGACTGTALTCTVSMTAPRYVAASFEPRPTLTALVVDAPGRVTSNPAGIDCTSSCTLRAVPNQDVHLTATPLPNTVFVRWSGACSGTSPSCVLTMPRVNTLVAAHFQTKPSLTVTVSGSGTVQSNPSGIDCGTACSLGFDPNAVVTLTAQANPGNEFSAWSGACTGATTTCSVTMDQAKSVFAAFRMIPPAAPASGGGGGGGGGGSIDWRLIAALLALLAMQMARRRSGRTM